MEHPPLLYQETNDFWDEESESESKFRTVKSNEARTTVGTESAKKNGASRQPNSSSFKLRARSVIQFLLRTDIIWTICESSEATSKASSNSDSL